MSESIEYRDRAKDSIKMLLATLKRDKKLLFGEDEDFIKTLYIVYVPYWGITDDEFQVVTDNIVRFLAKNPDNNWVYSENFDDEDNFYFRYIEAINALFYQTIIDLAGVRYFVNANKNSYYYLRGIRQQTIFSEQKFITITDLLQSLDSLKKFGIPSDEIMILRSCIVHGLKALTTESIRPITV